MSTCIHLKLSIGCATMCFENIGVVTILSVVHTLSQGLVKLVLFFFLIILPFIMVNKVV